MLEPKQIIERLYQIKENPGIYKSLSAEEQADILLFILTPKPLLKKTTTVKLEKGERGERGLNGTNSLTEAQQTAILTDLVGKIKVQNGKDAVVTTAMLEGIVAEVISRIELPDLEQVVTTTITADPTAIRNSLELLNDEERLKQSAIENLPEDLQKIRDTIVALPRGGNGIGKNQVYNFIKEAVADGTIPAGGAGGGAIDSVNTRTGAVTGLAENSDLVAHTSSTANPHSVTKAQIGLSNVPNTDFTASIATKQDTLVSATNIKTINGNSVLGSGNLIVGGSLTKGIAEVDFGPTEQGEAVVSVVDAAITATSYPVVTMYALTTADHDPDDYMAEGVTAYVTNVVAGVGFDIAAGCNDTTWGRYAVTFAY